MDFIYTYSDYQKQHQPDQALVARMASLAMRYLQLALVEPNLDCVSVTIPCLDPHLKLAGRDVVNLLKKVGDWNVLDTSYHVYRNIAAEVEPIADLFTFTELPAIANGNRYCIRLRIAL